MKSKKLNPLVIAFLQGAKWWEWYKENATMWQSDQKMAILKAQKLLKAGELGNLSNIIAEKESQ